MFRRVARTLLRPVRTFNRWWIDRMDPDWPGEPQASPAPSPSKPPPAPEPAPVRPRPSGPVSVWAEATPNPDAVKFVCSIALVQDPVTWREGEPTSDPLGQALVAIPGVRSAFAVGDFVTVTRSAGAEWDRLTEAVQHAIRSTLEG